METEPSLALDRAAVARRNDLSKTAFSFKFPELRAR